MENKQLMWSLLIHLSRNMWSDKPEQGYSRVLKFDEQLWNEIVEYAAEVGINAIVLDVGDAVVYKSHPEISIEGAWSREKVHEEIEKLKKLGIALYPKLNFSTCHDAWLGEYGKIVSTPTYYEVCKDLIHEVIDIFENPEYMHLGMDEEWDDFGIFGRRRDLECSRFNDLYFHDLNFFCDCAREKGSNPWIWADAYWRYPKLFVEKVPKDVLVSPWDYDYLLSDRIDLDRKPIVHNSIYELPEAGYNVVPCGSNYLTVVNIDHLTRYTMDKADHNHVMGFMMSSWTPTLADRKYTIFEGIQLVGNAIKNFQAKEREFINLHI